jgi:hypothetical protein
LSSDKLQKIGYEEHEKRENLQEGKCYKVVILVKTMVVVVVVVVAVVGNK